MKRYVLAIDGKYPDGAKMVEDLIGGWAWWKDVEQEFAQKDAEVERLKQEQEIGDEHSRRQTRKVRELIKQRNELQGVLERIRDEAAASWIADIADEALGGVGDV